LTYRRVKYIIKIRESVHEMNDNKKVYYLMSLNVVAYIRARGIEPLDEPIKTDDGKVKYIFEDTEEFRKLLTEYNNNEFIQMFIGKLRLTKNEIQLIKRM
jgi:hypothetical protein